jgi:tripartite motif-containing protein 71
MKRFLMVLALIPILLSACATTSTTTPPDSSKDAKASHSANSPVTDIPAHSSTITTPQTGLYSYDASWGSAGSALHQLQFPEGIAVDADGEVFIADTGNHRILVWTAAGKPLRSIGSFGSLANWRNPPQFNHPTGMLLLPMKRMYVADSLNHRIVVVDEQGQVANHWGEQGRGDGQFDRPRELALDRFNNVWVLDSGNSRVQVFGGPGSFKGTWGSFGKEAGRLKYPLGFALNMIDQCIVADTENYRYQVFNDQGAPVTQFGWLGDGPGQFKEPGGVAITPTGLIAIVDGTNARVVFLNNRFEPIGDWRTDSTVPATKEAPRFRGIASDRQGLLYLTDMANHRVLRLKPLKVQGFTGSARPTPTPTDADVFGGPGYPVR